MNDKSLKDLLTEQLDHRNLDPKKLAQATNIPEKYLESLLGGDYKKLPAAPYVRGYLDRVAAALNLNNEELWEVYQKEVSLKKSGPSDLLPFNRFAMRSIKKRTILIAALIALLIIYLLLNASRLFGSPSLEIINPPSATLVVFDPVFTIIGEINPQAKLLINGEEILIDRDGQFQKGYNLQPGLNLIEFSAKKFLGKETKVVKQIIYQPQ